jgi:hypothetical protein
LLEAGADRRRHRVERQADPGRLGGIVARCGGHHHPVAVRLHQAHPDALLRLHQLDGGGHRGLVDRGRVGGGEQRRPHPGERPFAADGPHVPAHAAGHQVVGDPAAHQPGERGDGAAA